MTYAAFSYNGTLPIGLWTCAVKWHGFPSFLYHAMQNMQTTCPKRHDRRLLRRSGAFESSKHYLII